jgi:hypothetical protein
LPIEDCRLLIAGLCLILAVPTAEPSVKTVLGRAGAYVAEYHERFTALVAEERYIQRTGPAQVSRPGSGLAIERERVLRSDYVIVRDFAGAGSWLGVRDVFEVDGEPVNADRTRLQSLLGDTTRPLASRVRALADLQAKYNLGDLYRTINVPTLALEFLLPDRQDRFRFKHTGTTQFRGTSAWIVAFEERDRPTIIRTPEGRDIKSSGTFWIDPATGAVLRSELRTGQIPGRPLHSIILVSYSHNARFAMLLPDDMNELYLTGRTRIEGHATYTNFRRFETAVRIK